MSKRSDSWSWGFQPLLWQSLTLLKYKKPTLVSPIDYKLFPDLSSKQSMLFSLSGPPSGHLHRKHDFSPSLGHNRKCCPSRDLKISFFWLTICFCFPRYSGNDPQQLIKWGLNVAISFTPSWEIFLIGSLSVVCIPMFSLTKVERAASKTLMSARNLFPLPHSAVALCFLSPFINAAIHYVTVLKIKFSAWVLHDFTCLANSGSWAWNSKWPQMCVSHFRVRFWQIKNHAMESRAGLELDQVRNNCSTLCGNLFFLISLSMAASLTCSSDRMTIVLSKAYLDSIGYNETHLQLNDPSCRPITTDQVIFSFPLNSCETTKEVKRGKKGRVQANTSLGMTGTHQNSLWIGWEWINSRFTFTLLTQLHISRLEDERYFSLVAPNDQRGFQRKPRVIQTN